MDQGYWNWVTFVSAVCGVTAIGFVVYGILMRRKGIAKDDEDACAEAFLSFIGAGIFGIISFIFLLLGLFAAQ